MEYSLGVQPYSVQDINCYNCQYESYPPYPLLIIDKESYIVEAKIENSDSGWIPMGRLVHNFQIGRYCSLAGNLHFLIGRDKNYFNVTTSAAKVFQLTEGEENWKHHKGSIILQNDVWVGSNSSFVSGVIVHNGAIVAAHSHVVKDVPPYAIVGGNPARVIGWRFDKEIIDKLQTIQWWYWSQEKLEQNAKYFNDDIVEFCDRFYDEAKAEVERVKEEKIPTGEYDSYLCVIDDTDAYMVFPSAMNDFVEIYSKNKEKKLILFYLTGEQKNEKTIQRIKHIIANVNDKLDCKMQFLEGDMEYIKRIFPSVKHFITNRREETVRLICEAELYGDEIEIISGIDFPIFSTGKTRGSVSIKKQK